MRFKSEIVEEDIEALLFALRQSKEAVVKGQGSVAELLENCLQDHDIVEGGTMFEEIEGVKEGVGIGDEIVALWVGFCSCWPLGEDEGRHLHSG